MKEINIFINSCFNIILPRSFSISNISPAFKHSITVIIFKINPINSNINEVNKQRNESIVGIVPEHNGKTRALITNYKMLVNNKN